MSHFKSIVSSSLLMSLCLLPNLVSANTNNRAYTPGQGANQYQGWSNNAQQHYSYSDEADDEGEDKKVNGDQSPYAYQDWNQNQRIAYASQDNSSWRDKWDRHYGSTANNTHYYSSNPNQSNASQYNYNNTPESDDSINSSYVSSPTRYDANGYPAYQSYPADGYYYNAGYSNSSPTQYNASGYPSYRTYPADGYYYNTNHYNSYPYSQDYHRGSGVGAGVYFNVR